jgi:hypothetical protein
MKNVAFLISFLSFIFLNSCKSQEEVTISLINQELYYCVNPDSLSNFKRKFDENYQRESSSNIVKFKITNNTNKKYLFLVKDIFLKNLANIEIRIYEDDSLIYLENPLTTPYFKNDEESTKFFNYYEFENEKINNAKKVLKKMGFKTSIYENEMSFVDQSVIIGQSESIIFYSTIQFPYIVEDDIINLKKPSYFNFKKGKKYEFSLKYNLRDDIEKLLPQEILNNLKDNNIEIFKGNIETQRIPIINTFK